MQCESDSEKGSYFVATSHLSFFSIGDSQEGHIEKGLNAGISQLQLGQVMSSGNVEIDLVLMQ